MSALLAAVFLSHAPEVRRARFAAAPNLEEELASLASRGRATWPEIALTDADFMEFLGRLLPEHTASRLGALRADDLWIACAYGRGAARAAEALEEMGFLSIAGTLRRLGAAPPLIADVLQEMRRRVFEMQDPRPGQKAYAGVGCLIGWLRISAVRELNHRRGRAARELSIEDRPALLAPCELEPEVALLLKTQKRELSAAFREALSSLSTRERNVLRYSYVEGLSIDQMGALYGVHRATAARWVSRASEELSSRTRAFLRARMSLSDEGFLRLVGLLESQIRVELAVAEAQ